jgi:hypothetical protein
MNACLKMMASTPNIVSMSKQKIIGKKTMRNRSLFMLVPMLPIVDSDLRSEVPVHGEDAVAHALEFCYDSRVCALLSGVGAFGFAEHCGQVVPEAGIDPFLLVAPRGVGAQSHLEGMPHAADSCVVPVFVFLFFILM